MKSKNAWRIVYIFGGAAALIALLVFRRYLGVEFMEFNGFGIFDVPAAWPASAIEWITLFQENPFVGLVLFNFIDVINYLLVGLIFLALYGALRDVAQGTMAMALVIALAGIAIFAATSQTFAMRSLSEQFGEAVTETERAVILAAAGEKLAINNPGAVFPGVGPALGLFLVALAGMLISIVMLRSPDFGKICAVSGILANFFIFAYFLALLLKPEWAWIMALSAPFRILWYLLIAIRLFQLSIGSGKEKPIHE